MPMILKMDDDIVVDYNELVKKLEAFSPLDRQRKIFGLQHFGMDIQRHGKWALGQNDLREIAARTTYPNFLSGNPQKFTRLLAPRREHLFVIQGLGLWDLS